MEQELVVLESLLVCVENFYKDMVQLEELEYKEFCSTLRSGKIVEALDLIKLELRALEEELLG